MESSVNITFLGGGETVLTALARTGIAFSAPCGGRGVCGKCRLTLIKGTVRLVETGQEITPGDSFLACRARASTDIIVSLPNVEIEDSPLAVMATGRKIRRAGVGLDIGTTTVQARLICLDTGESLETISALNDQRSFGADVMSRIDAARNGKTAELFAAINHQVKDILKQFTDKWGLSGIERCTVSGNTTMLHFFAGENPSGMGEAPFTPVFLEERYFSGEDLSLSVKQIILLPGISAFVGADIVSGLAFVDILNCDESSLFVDIGTNGEIAVWDKSKRRLLCCSTAAGPCFEGAEISHGMGAVNGAINRISLKEDMLAANSFRYGPLFYTTLGNAQACGINGTGLIDAIAVMRKLGAIDETGALAACYALSGFPVADGIVVTQQDVRRFQLAKAAIFSGIKVLCKKAGLEPAHIGTAYIAGGLGFFLNLENAAETGLLPCGLISKAAVPGNTSLKGAVKSLTDPAFLPRCREIVSCSSAIELALNSDFAQCFTDNMGF